MGSPLSSPMRPAQRRQARVGTCFTLRSGGGLCLRPTPAGYCSITAACPGFGWLVKPCTLTMQLH
ncbi:hypothetical protein [Lysobacter gummosus]|uniref:hypothetical protein n=1 Tax=Lysobacter gummosus TaxID=262324 RepID=UPI003638E326